MERHCSSLEQDAVAAFLPTLQSGDVGILPAGTAVWTKGDFINWSPPPNVTLKGMGDLSIRGGSVDHFKGATHIIDAVDRSGYDYSLLNINQPAEGWLRVAGISMTRDVSDYWKTLSYNGHIRMFGDRPDGPCFVVDHCSFSYMQALSTFGRYYGLIKECYLSLASTRQYGIGNGDTNWIEPTDLGTNKFIYHEDCTFDLSMQPRGGASQDAYFGGRFAFRYNLFIDSGVQTHPTGGSGRARGARAWEVYRNKFKGTQNSFNMFFMSSGNGVVHNNDFSEARFSNMITLHAMRRHPATYPQWATPDGWGYAGTSYNGVGSNWDGNENPVTGWPNIDMIGSDEGDQLSGEFPNCVNVTRGNLPSTDPNCHPHQKRSGFYEWNNNFTPDHGSGGTKLAVYEGDTILAGRDFFPDTERPGYVEYQYPHELNYLITGSEPTPQPPAVPTSLTAELASEKSAKLTWSDNSSNEAGFIIERANSGSFAEIARVGANVGTFTNIGLEAETKYSYRVRAFNAAGISDESNVAEVTTPATPVPEPNVPPEITQFVLKNGSQILDPNVPITIKNVTIAVAAKDDVGIIRLRIRCKDIVLKEASPEGNPTTMTVTWNTAPYRGKGPVLLQCEALDADGSVTSRSMTVTVAKK